MPTYDEAFVKRFLKPWNEHNVDGAVALMSDDCIWEVTRGSQPYGTRFKGLKEIRAAVANSFRAMPSVHYELIRNSVGQDHLTIELLVTGKLADGTPAKYQACDILTVKDGKIIAKRSYRKVVE